MRQLSPTWNIFVGVVCGLWGLLFLYMGLVKTFAALYIVPACLPVAIIITYSMYPMRKTRSLQTRPSVLDLLVMAVSIPVCVYLFLHAAEYMRLSLIWRPPTMADSVCGLILGIILLEAGRRTVGWVLTGLVLLFFFYILFISSYMPGMWYCESWDWKMLFGELVRDTSRGFTAKLPFLVVAILGPFMLIGPTLFATGIGRVCLGIGRWAGSRMSGGAAMVSVVGSAFFGTISGSAVSNVVTTGAFTIPMMKSAGFKPELAGAVEAAASQGGQIMPPVMGAVAFIMPEFVPGITYFDVCKAAIIPAVLYFFLVGCSVYFYAKRERIGRLTGESAVGVGEIMRDWPGLVIVVAVLSVLVYLLYERWPTGTCGASALVVGAGLHLLIGGSPKPRAVWNRFVDLVRGFTVGGKVLAWLFLLMALLQVIIFTLGATGLGLAVSRAVLNMAGGGGALLFPALLVCAVACLIMGMGVTTTAAYIIVVATMAHPVVQLLGIGLVAHMFIFYFCTLGGLTPPVCATVYPAAAIAQARWLPVAGYAMLLGLVAFIYPFFFAYDPAVLMIGSASAIIQGTITSFIGIFFLSSGIWGQLYRRTSWVERILMSAGGLLLMCPGTLTDLGGVAAIILGLVVYGLRSRLLHQAA